jgi:bifunctional non-homologous end joining protein LigD
MSLLRFVVQKHAAATPRYDFLLEMDGVLKSWAVAKEPTADRAVKRLAVPTRDHPVEYAQDYGVGRADPWDRGTWVPEEAPLPAYRRGKLQFELKGKRLKGRWALVRMGNAQTRKKDLWVLMKRDDGDGQ